MNNKSFYIGDLIDYELIEDLKDAATFWPLYDFLELKNHNLLKLILLFCKRMTMMMDDITDINEIKNRNDISLFIVYISILKDGIEKIINSISSEIQTEVLESRKLFYNDWKLFWLNSVKVPINEFTSNMDDVLQNDDNFIEYLRSIIVHPYETSRHPKFGSKDNPFHKYLKTQGVPVVTLIRKNINWTNNIDYNSYEICIEIVNLDKVDKESKKWENFYLYVDPNNLKTYFKDKYNEINKIISYLNLLKEKYKNQLNKKISWPNNDIDFLKKVILELKNKFFWTNYLDKFLRWYEKSSKEDFYNSQIVKNYFNDIITHLRNNVNLIENCEFKNPDIEWDLVNNLINELSFLKYDRVYKNNEYNKHLSYSLSNPNDNRYESEVVKGYCNFIKKYTHIDINKKKLNFDEIKLLIDVSIYEWKKIT